MEMITNRAAMNLKRYVIGYVFFKMCAQIFVGYILIYALLGKMLYVPSTLLNTIKFSKKREHIDIDKSWLKMKLYV